MMNKKTKSLGQSKKMTICESIVNVFCGMFIAFSISQLAGVFQEPIREYIWAGFHWNVGVTSNLFMTFLLTFVSIARGYIFRRIFNRLHEKQLQQQIDEERI